MSNAQVGMIYQQIIADVLEASRVDLEENGVDEGILEELKQGWQKKLSAQNLAAFPWDPKPDPPVAAPAPPAPAPQAAQVPVHHDAGIINGAGLPAQRAGPPQNVATYPVPANAPVVKAEPGVKVEPGLEPTAMPQSYPQPSGAAPPAVHARVINNLQTQFGARADATINKLQENQWRQPGHQQQQNPPPAHPPNHSQAQQQYRQQLAAGNLQQTMPQHVQNGQKPNPSQFDGTTEEAVLVHQHASGQKTEIGRVEIDRMLHAQLEARAKAMEGGGLMVPLQRAKKVDPISYHRAQSSSGHGRFDGGDDEIKSEEDDEAINSDLDDSDDNADDDDEDDDGGQIMLCMYDKVQRVKNKWKCVLKDGVLSVNGKDYVFHKASGEYEW